MMGMFLLSLTTSCAMCSRSIWSCMFLVSVSSSMFCILDISSLSAVGCTRFSWSAILCFMELNLSFRLDVTGALFVLLLFPRVADEGLWADEDVFGVRVELLLLLWWLKPPPSEEGEPIGMPIREPGVKGTMPGEKGGNWWKKGT